MNDERLTALLGSMRHERIDRIADAEIRAKLETAWTARQERRSFTFRLRRIAPMLATLAVVAILSGMTMTASGESPLYGIRVAVEDAAVALHADPEDRAEYLVTLLEQRQAEAARLESTGNALAASRARKIEQDTLRVVRAMLPQAPEVQPLPAPAPTSTPTLAPSPTPPPAAPLVAPPTATQRPATPRPTTPAPVPTTTPTPVKTSPIPTGTPMPVLVSGTVRNADGALADGVCVMLNTGGGCLGNPTVQGAYRYTLSGRVNQTITLYFMRQDGTVLWKGTVSGMVRSGILQMPDVKLQK